jgi:hypothetical protein
MQFTRVAAKRLYATYTLLQCLIVKRHTFGTDQWISKMKGVIYSRLVGGNVLQITLRKQLHLDMARSHSDLPTLSLLRGSYIKVLS